MVKLAAGAKAFGFVGVAEEVDVLDASKHGTSYPCELTADYGRKETMVLNVRQCSVTRSGLLCSSLRVFLMSFSYLHER